MENIEKIQKLIALQEDAIKQGSLAEAENAALKIQALLLKYNLDMAQVNGHEKEVVMLKSLSGKGMGWNKRQGKWVHALFNGICEYNFGKLVLGSGWDTEEVKLHVMAEKHNLEVIEYLGYTLVQKLLKLEPPAWRSYDGDDKRGTFRRGYFQGAVMGITSRLREQREREMANNDQVTALVMVKSQAVQEYREKEFPNLKKSKGSSTSASDQARQMGFQDGRKQSINKGVGQATPAGRIN